MYFTLSLNPATQITTEFPVIPNTTVSVTRTVFMVSIMASVTILLGSFLLLGGSELLENIMLLRKTEHNIFKYFIIVYEKRIYTIWSLCLKNI